MTRFVVACSKRLGHATKASVCAIFSPLEIILHPRRFRKKNRARANREFLERLNFQQIDDGDLSYIDGKGNALRRVQTTKTQITFIVVGSRRRRAYINLDKKGRYISYTGPIKI